MPETDETQALAAVERARAAIAGIELDGGLTITVSAGICGPRARHRPRQPRPARRRRAVLGQGPRPRRGLGLRPRGRRELSISERADQLQRTQALVGIRALARAIDAKDQSTREHSQRVATLACDIARRLAVERRSASRCSRTPPWSTT
jgi:hypothetical protein